MINNPPVRSGGQADQRGDQSNDNSHNRAHPPLAFMAWPVQPGGQAAATSALRFRFQTFMDFLPNTRDDRFDRVIIKAAPSQESPQLALEFHKFQFAQAPGALLGYRISRSSVIHASQGGFQLLVFQPFYPQFHTQQ